MASWLDLSEGQEQPHRSPVNGGVGKVRPGIGLVSDKRGGVLADGASGIRAACAVPRATVAFATGRALLAPRAQPTSLTPLMRESGNVRRLLEAQKKVGFRSYFGPFSRLVVENFIAERL